MINIYFDDFYNNVLLPLAGFFTKMPLVVRVSVSTVVSMVLIIAGFKLLRRVMQ